MLKTIFHFNRSGRSEAVCILLFRRHSGKTIDMVTKDYATFRYHTVEVKNELKGCFPLLRFLFEVYILLNLSYEIID